MSGRPVDSKGKRGFTAIEVVLVLVMLGLLAAIGIPLLGSSIRRARIEKAVVEITAIQHDIRQFVKRFQEYPLTLAEVGHGARRDPWGHPYQYLYFAILPKSAKGQMRKDKNLVPLNTDFDLYSMGPDGESMPPLTARQSRDDIIRANDGDFVGVAADY